MYEGRTAQSHHGWLLRVPLAATAAVVTTTGPTLRPAILAARLPICTVVVLKGLANSCCCCRGCWTTGSIAALLLQPQPTSCATLRIA